MTKGVADARACILGNPSDIYGGKCISFTFSNQAEVEVVDSDKLWIHGEHGSDSHLTYNGSNDLIKATVKHLGLENRLVEISYKSEIPKGFGLSGSSAIIIAAIRAFNEHFNLGLNKNSIAELALHTEVDELGISAGFQDRYVISHGGVCYMDFSGKEYLRAPEIDGYGRVEKLGINFIPFFLCFGSEPKSSAIIHNSLREKFLKGGEEAGQIKRHMDKLAQLAEQGVEPLLKRDWKEVGRLINKNNLLRNQICNYLETDVHAIDYALESGAYGAKVAGSGGGVIVLSDEENIEEVHRRVCRKYPCLRPRITTGA